MGAVCGLPSCRGLCCPHRLPTRARQTAWPCRTFRRLCLLLFAAGEEISWGQRLFEIGTPPELASINSQGELNVHDVVEAQGKFNLALAAISLYALVAPWAARRPSLLIPPAALSSALLAAFTYTVPRAHASPLFFSAARYVSA